MPAAGGPWCRCGHAQHWHRDWAGRCEITGPQPSDGCDCRAFTPTTPTDPE